MPETRNRENLFEKPTSTLFSSIANSMTAYAKHHFLYGNGQRQIGTRRKVQSVPILTDRSPCNMMQHKIKGCFITHGPSAPTARGVGGSKAHGWR
ncbi:hypothetical protein [Asticcacaulis sp.]|uniref:hypothetical protein n=1 Tax=Asticcacaulis sp. TaxID=1872648 RepID=UPI00261A206F|nr:hypothetical protein [Asticcacaulis sp.]